MLDLGAATAADFLTHVGTAFARRDGTDLHLAAVTQHGPGAHREQFSLVFTTDADTLLPQGIQELSHPTLGDLALFLVPIGPGADGQHRYEAAFA
ncbi:hypothetical protein FHX52_2407 [Humibacillus xanthopallidus]|uniref:DUF6916 domain-containing protein n=1 Tax=Humibacillus xanthopallidus TaxID=412689 RepID=A0A543PNV1_9MICO|nr:hypothetical protein [Humibacillus xanthopallidus]TQN45707.1 hypothetical protein FHX52_2407 [Humibacillus xanthopallidus]